MAGGGVYRWRTIGSRSGVRRDRQSRGRDSAEKGERLFDAISDRAGDEAVQCGVMAIAVAIGAADMSIELTRQRQARSASRRRTTTPLLDVLRNQLDLKGSRYGCGLEQCGSCMVLIDGEPDLRLRARGRHGRRAADHHDRGSGLAPHPLQQAFLDEQAGQCGYCLSGIIMSAPRRCWIATRRRRRADIVAALDKHLCRCGAHPRILRAVEKAAAALREGAAR